jgi:hypothetical protein
MAFHGRTTFKSACLYISLLFLAACTLGPGKGGSGSYPSTGHGKEICPGTPDSIYKPTKQAGINSFYDLVPIKEFDLPTPPAQILLRVTVAYKSHPSERDLMIGINGIKATRADGYTGFDDACFSGDSGNSRSCQGSSGNLCSTTRYIILNNLTLNGGVDMYTMLTQIRAQKGLLKISLQAPDISIVSTQLEITSQAHCAGSGSGGPSPSPSPGPSPTPTPTPQPSPTPTSTPTPTPTPVAANVQITTTVPAVATTNSTNMSVSFSADQNDVTFKCALDSASPSACNSPATYSSLTNGSHTFSVTATNSAGLTSQPATYSWAIDTTPPTVVIQPVSSPTNANPVVVTFTSNKGQIFYCALDGVTSALCTSPLSLPNIPEGQHLLAVQAVDSLGNMSDPSTVQWVEDLTPPTVQILSQVPSATLTNVKSRTISFIANESSSYQCSLDGAAFAACDSPYASNNLSEGQHTFNVQATDAAGNLGLPASASWTSDYTSPVITLGQVLPAAGLTNSSNYSVAFTSNDSTSQFYCSMDGVTATTCTSPYTGAFTSDGMHELSIYAIDQAGNSSASVVVDWNVDRTSGVLSWSSITPSGAAINVNAIQLIVAATKAEMLAATLNGNSVAIDDNVISLSGLSEGSYNVQVNGVDAAGNPTNTLAYEFTVDMTPPQISLASAVDTSTGALPTQSTANTLTMTSNEAVTYQCQLDSSGFAPCQSPDQLSGLIDGEHEFDAQAIDAAGNVSTVASVTWTVDTAAPITTASFIQVSYGDFTFDFTTSETVATTYCSLDNAIDVACTSPYVLKNLAAGSHVMYIHSVDLAGNIETKGALLSFTATAPPPPADTVLVAPNYTLTNQTTVTFQFSSSASGATFTCSLDGAAMAACTSPSGYAGLKDGAHVFKVIAINTIGQPDPSGGKSFSWTIDTVAPTVSIASAVDTTKTTTSKTNTLTISASEQATLQCQLDAGTWATCTSPVSYSALADGAHTFSAKATDAAGNVGAAASVTWTVDSTPPVTTASVNTSNGSEGVVTFTFSANETVQGFFCSLDGATAASCTSPYTISNVTFGSHTMVIHAVDTIGNVENPGTTLSFTLNAPNANTILVAPNYQYTNQKSITFSFSSNAPGATFLCALNSTNYAACTSPMTYSGLSDNSYTFNVIAVNATGQRDSNGGQSFSWIVDTVAPTIISSSPVPSTTSVTISWTTNEASTGQIAYGVGTTITSATTETTTALTSNSVTVSGLTASTSYTMQIKGHDRAGNAYAGSTFTIKTR